MALRRWGLMGLLMVAGLALWLLLAGPGRLLGIETNNAGIYLLMAATWGALLAVQRWPREDVDAVSPGEWRAWIGLAFMTAAIAYLLAKSAVLAAAPLPANPDAGAVGRNLVLLFVAWIALSQVMQSRWSGQVHEDERDRVIERRASDWSRCALSVGVLVLAVMLGMSPADRVAWATPPAVANLLLFELLVAAAVGHAVSVVSYVRDRRA
jgi:uncharacterized membrane protein